MKARPRSIAPALVVILALVVAVLVGCGGTTAGEGDTPPGGGDASGESPAATSTPPGQDASTTPIAAYFMGEDERLVPAGRVAQSPAVGADAMIALTGGPSDAEAAAGLTTLIPAGTAFRGLKIEKGVATVDLSPEFTGGGGTYSMTGRVAQVVYTLTQFDSVDGVLFLIAGEPLDVLGGEGVILEGPQTREDWPDFAPEDDTPRRFE